MPNGLLLQWGDATTTYQNANVLGAGVTFKVNYNRVPFVFAHIIGTNNAAIEMSENIKIQNKEVSKFNIFLHSTASAFKSGDTRNFNWFAIGY